LNALRAPWALKSRDFLIYIRRSKRGKKHINKPLLNEPSFIVIDFYRTLNGINKQTNKTNNLSSALFYICYLRSEHLPSV